MWIDRRIECLLLQSARTHPVVVLQGARQTGKTSLVKRLFSTHGYVSLELPNMAERADQDPTSFLVGHPHPIIVDEVQNAPGLFRHLTSIHSQYRQEGSFILVRSRAIESTHSVLESAADRVAIFSLEPLSFIEAKSAYPDITANEFLIRSGYPQLYADLGLDARDFLHSYVSSFLEGDLQAFLRVANLSDYECFIRACALQSARLLNQAALARAVGVASSTLSSWLKVLVSSHLAYLLEPWQSGVNTALVKRPKLYLNDAGLAAFLCGIHTVDDLYLSPFTSTLWQTLVCSEIRRSQICKQGDSNLNFWMDRSTDADFLVPKGDNFHLADAKWIQYPNSRDTKGLIKVSNSLGSDEVRFLSIVCHTPNSYPICDGVNAIPLEGISNSSLVR